MWYQSSRRIVLLLWRNQTLRRFVIRQIRNAATVQMARYTARYAPMQSRPPRTEAYVDIPVEVE